MNKDFFNIKIRKIVSAFIAYELVLFFVFSVPLKAEASVFDKLPSFLTTVDTVSTTINTTAASIFSGTISNITTGTTLFAEATLGGIDNSASALYSMIGNTSLHVADTTLAALSTIDNSASALSGVNSNVGAAAIFETARANEAFLDTARLLSDTLTESVDQIASDVEKVFGNAGYGVYKVATTFTTGVNNSAGLALENAGGNTAGVWASIWALLKSPFELGTDVGTTIPANTTDIHLTPTSLPVSPNAVSKPSVAPIYVTNTVSNSTNLESRVRTLENQFASLTFTNSGGISRAEVMDLISGSIGHVGSSLGQAITNVSNNTTVSGGSGTVTSIDISGGTTGLTFAGGPVTSSGTLTLAGTLAIANGGTGSATAPTYGQILVGNALGGYTLTATSSLGITSGVSSQWTTAGSDIYYDTGKVGIGTIAQTSALEVDGSVGIGEYYSGGAAGASDIPTGGLGVTGSIIAGGTVNSYISLLNSGGGTRIHLDTDDDSYFLDYNFGIGTNDPQHRLDVDGGFNFTGDFYHEGILNNYGSGNQNGSISAAAPTGFISINSVPFDGEFLEISDGSSTFRFEFDDNSSLDSGGDIPIDITSLDIEVIMSNLETAISNSGLTITVDFNSSTELILTHNTTGSIGNQQMTNETSGSTAIYADGMQGGVDGGGPFSGYTYGASNTALAEFTYTYGANITNDVFGSVQIGNGGQKLVFDGSNGINYFASGGLAINTNDADGYAVNVNGDINFSGNLLQNGTPFSGGQWTTDGSDIRYNDGSVNIGDYISLENDGDAIFSTVQTNTISLTGGVTGDNPTPRLSFGSYADDVGDPSISHIDLYGGIYGFGISNGQVNYMSNGGHAFFVNNTLSSPALMLTSAGYLGVGSSTPSAKLSVKGSGTGTGRLFALSNSSDAEKFTILDNGKVGIGTTSPTALFSVAGDTFIGGGKLTISTVTDSIPLILKTGSLNSMAVSEDGALTSYSTEFGQGNTITYGSTIFGVNNIGAHTSTVFGYNSTASTVSGAQNQTVFGNTNVTTGISLNAAVFGYASKGTGAYANSFGILSGAATSSVAYGTLNNFTFNGFASDGTPSGGTLSTTIGTQSIAFGIGNITSAATSTAIGYRNTASAINAIAIGSNITNGTTNSLMIGPSDAAKLTILSTGNFGIGTTSPYAKLSVVGSGSNTLIAADATSGFTGRLIDLKIASTTKFMIDSSGNVGVGTTSPWGLLSINPDGIAGPAFVIGSTTASKFVVSNGGNVGIGTVPNANYMLDILNSGSAQIRLNSSSSGATFQFGGTFGQFQNTGGTFYITNDTATSPIIFRTDGGTERLRISAASSNGNIGIGTSSPYARLSVEGASVLGTNALAGYFISTTTTASTFPYASTTAISSTGSAYFATSGGTVGIGTSTPISTLSIQGSLCVRNTGSCGTTAGTIYATTAAITAIDLAENYPTNDPTLAPGDVVSLDASNPSYIKRAIPHDTTPVIGIISTAPGLLLGKEIENGKAVALAGRVPVKFSTENGSVKIGDYLTLSSTTPGVAVKATKSTNIIGTVLEDASTNGTIVVFVKTGFQNIFENIITSSSDVVDNSSLLDTLGALLSGAKSWMYQEITAVNGFFKNIFAERITTKTLCIEDVCITKDQLQNILNKNNTAAVIISTTPAPSPAPTPTPAPAPDTGTSTPQVEPEPTPTPTPEVVTPPAEESTPVVETPAPAPALAPTPTPEAAPAASE